MKTLFPISKRHTIVSPVVHNQYTISTVSVHNQYTFQYSISTPCIRAALNGLITSEIFTKPFSNFADIISVASAAWRHNGIE